MESDGAQLLNELSASLSSEHRVCVLDSLQRLQRMRPQNIPLINESIRKILVKLITEWGYDQELGRHALWCLRHMAMSCMSEDYDRYLWENINNSNLYHVVLRVSRSEVENEGVRGASFEILNRMCLASSGDIQHIDSEENIQRAVEAVALTVEESMSTIPGFRFLSSLLVASRNFSDDLQKRIDDLLTEGIITLLQSESAKKYPNLELLLSLFDLIFVCTNTVGDRLLVECVQVGLISLTLQVVYSLRDIILENLRLRISPDLFATSLLKRIVSLLELMSGLSSLHEFTAPHASEFLSVLTTLPIDEDTTMIHTALKTFVDNLYLKSLTNPQSNMYSYIDVKNSSVL